MNKKEFLNELENALAGRLPEADIREVTSDYGDIFDNGTAGGKGEEEVAAELGSPAKIARTILEDSADGVGRTGPGESGTDPGAGSDGGSGRREYTDFQKKVNEKTSGIFDKVVEPDRSVATESLTPMSRRLGAYVIDSAIVGGLAILLLVIALLPLSFMRTTSSGVYMPALEMDFMGVSSGATIDLSHSVLTGLTGFFPLLLLLGAFNLFTTIILWATNGYTPGKYILKMRVIKVNGGKISFLDALLRELVIKGIANSMFSGFLNLGSFIWGCATADHKTVHDLVTQTRVVQWDRAGK